MAKYGEGKTKVGSARFTEEEFEILQELADKDNRSVSDYIRLLILERIDKYDDK